MHLKWWVFVFYCENRKWMFFRHTICYSSTWNSEPEHINKNKAALLLQRPFLATGHNSFLHALRFSIILLEYWPDPFQIYSQASLEVDNQVLWKLSFSWGVCQWSGVKVAFLSFVWMVELLILTTSIWPDEDLLIKHFLIKMCGMEQVCNYLISLRHNHLTALHLRDVCITSPFIPTFEALHWRQHLNTVSLCGRYWFYSKF